MNWVIILTNYLSKYMLLFTIIFFLVLMDIILGCIAILTENSKCIDEGFTTFSLSNLITPFKNINKPYLSSFGNIQRNYLIVLNHFVHYTSLLHDVSIFFQFFLLIKSIIYL